MPVNHPADASTVNTKIRSISLLLLFLLVFVLPIPGTIALRHTLLLVLLVAAIWTRDRTALKRLPRWAMVSLGALTVWLIGQAMLFSQETAWALHELRGQWLPALIAFVCGLLLVSRAADGSRVISAILGGLIAQTFFSLMVSLPYALANGVFPEGATLWTAGKLEISYLNNLLLAFVVVDLVSRTLWKQRVSQWPVPILVLALLLAIASNLAFGARNGVIGSALLFFSVCIVVLIRHWRQYGGLRMGAGLVLCVSLVIALGAVNGSTDPRWQKFAETARIAWDIDTYKFWLDERRYPLPVLQDGSPVDASAYLRVAWIRAGLRLIAQHPLGVGFGRNAFGHALRMEAESPVGHAHSGMIDLGVGAGLPGLMLWLALVGGAAWLGLRDYIRRRSSLGLLLFFCATGFLGRMCIDSINRDHMLVLFFLILGILLSGMATETDSPHDKPALR